MVMFDERPLSNYARRFLPLRGTVCGRCNKRGNYRKKGVCNLFV